VTAGAARDTRIADFNGPDSVRRAFDQAPPAAVIVEPVPGNMGVVPPEEGFLQELRGLCNEHGALLIFDEVMSGFRIARGGAVERYGIIPDLITFGKVIGGGLPVGAYGGRRDLMQMISPSGPVYQAGTLSGNPLAMTAGLETLRLLDDEAYQTLEERSARLEHGLVEALAAAGAPGVVQRVGSMLTLFFSSSPVADFAGARRCDHARFGRFFHEMLGRGVHLPPSGYEAWFVSTAHEENDIDSTIEAARRALEVIG
jgi:glutamate-1-semialdehyde 2,1-aminomutase